MPGPLSHRSEPVIIPLGQCPEIIGGMVEMEVGQRVICSLPQGPSKLPRSPTISQVSFFVDGFLSILPLASMYEAYTKRKKNPHPRSNMIIDGPHTLMRAGYYLC